MPFDGNPAKFVKPEVFSLPGLIAWLETQDPQQRYEYENCEGRCLIGQYLAARGVPWGWRSYDAFVDADARMRIANRRPMTFGAALSRARQLLATA